MKPAPFHYERPTELQQALQLLADVQAQGRDARVMAGGQSLVPMMNFRLVKPDVVVDIARLQALDVQKEAPGGGLVLGALTRHITAELSPLVARHFPLIPEVLRHVAHLAIRNMGTIGGSLSHADPAAEWPMLVKLLDATLVAGSVRGERRIAAEDFFLGPLTTSLDSDELLLRIEFPPLPPSTGAAFEEFSRRPGDYALAAVGVTLVPQAGHVQQARVALMGVGDTPLRSPQAEAVLQGQPWSENLVRRAVRAGCEALQPRRDLNASADYRRHLAGELMDHTLRQAWQRATGGA